MYLVRYPWEYEEYVDEHYMACETIKDLKAFLLILGWDWDKWNITDGKFYGYNRRFKDEDDIRQSIAIQELPVFNKNIENILKKRSIRQVNR